MEDALIRRKKVCSFFLRTQSHQRIRSIAIEDDAVDRRGVVGHADAVRLGPVLLVVVGDGGGEGPGQHPEKGQGRVVVQRVTQPIRGHQRDR